MSSGTSASTAWRPGTGEASLFKNKAISFLGAGYINWKHTIKQAKSKRNAIAFANGAQNFENFDNLGCIHVLRSSLRREESSELCSEPSVDVQRDDIASCGSDVNAASAPPLISENQTDSVNHGLPNMPDEYSKYLLSLNESQREAACSDISVPLMIVAGPGSGKTSTMVGRVLMLLNEGISALNILAMAFTTAAAASEMRDQIGSVTGKATAKLLTISTFHSFSLQLCRSHTEKLERTPEFLIYGHGQQRRAIIEAVRLSEDEKSKTNLNVAIDGEESNGVTSPHHFKDASKKWLKFVTGKNFWKDSR